MAKPAVKKTSAKKTSAKKAAAKTAFAVAKETLSSARFKEIEKNYLQAASNYYADMVRTKSEAEAQAVDQNYKEAETAWAKALISVLEADSDAAEAITANLVAANEAVTAAREASEGLEKLLKVLKTATGVANLLVKVAAL